MKTPSDPSPVCKHNASSYACRKTSANQFAEAVYRNYEDAEHVDNISNGAHLLHTDQGRAEIELNGALAHWFLQSRRDRGQKVYQKFCYTLALL